MSPEQYGNFIDFAYENEVPAIQGDQIKTIFESADSDKDGYLTLRDFLDFYLLACHDRRQIVWNNLRKYIKRNDLKEPVDISKVHECALVSNIISSNSAYCNTLFHC